MGVSSENDVFMLGGGAPYMNVSFIEHIALVCQTLKIKSS
jgi:hypothetical protein